VRLIVVGLGIQGRKRLEVAGPDVVATVDPLGLDADYGAVKEVPLDSYDGALVCVPDPIKLEILPHLIESGKHVLVEKPLCSGEPQSIATLQTISRRNGAVCYTAYNHRFEPHFVRMKDLIESGRLGTLYRARMFYGNGTARDVRSSPWRDQGAGVLSDLGSHLLDTALFWFGPRETDFRIEAAHRFENRAFDHIVFRADGPPALQLEASLVSWRNHFVADVYGERGSAHIESLCKWGPTRFTFRSRVLPSGRPAEETVTLVQPDPTWTLEYGHFKRLCEERVEGNLANDVWIGRELGRLGEQALERFPV
jgi:predicted dehydrogenase